MESYKIEMSMGEISYRCLGEGNSNTVILLHGYEGLSDTLITLANQLALTYKVILIDMPYHGVTKVNKGLIYITHELYSQILNSIIEEMLSMGLVQNLTKLVGVGYGGTLAIELSTSFKVETVIAFDPILFSEKSITSNGNTYLDVLKYNTSEINLMPLLNSAKNNIRIYMNEDIERDW